MSVRNDGPIFRSLRVPVLLGGLMVPVTTLAQNCALCYTQAAAAGARIVQGLRSGIIILALPPVLICIALAVVTYRKRNQFNEE